MTIDDKNRKHSRFLSDELKIEFDEYQEWLRVAPQNEGCIGFHNWRVINGKGPHPGIAVIYDDNGGFTETIHVDKLGTHSYSHIDLELYTDSFEEGDLMHLVKMRRDVPPPTVGDSLVKWGSLLLSERAYKRLIEPHVLDMRYETQKALEAGDLGKARWIKIRGYFLALKPFLYGVASALVALWKVAR